MKKYLDDYIDIIKLLPLKEKYLKTDIINEKFLIEKHGDIEIYYAPHNEFVNRGAKVFIVGITPGFQQMSTALVAARKGIEEKLSVSEIQYKCKVAGRFSGSLRKNIINMLDEVQLNKALKIESCRELFESRDDLLHTISLIPYAVFVKGKNYTGHTPKLIKNKFLMKYIDESFINELELLGEVLIIPLGKAVEEVMEQLIDKNIIKSSNVLKGFPHPSGANVNRLVQLEEHKENMIKIIEKKFKEY